jgi:hypothetical protein
MEKTRHENQLTRYRDFRPTGFDAPGLGLPDSQDWFVVPVMQSRDSNVLEESNFASALQALGGESDTVEVHRFGHWGPGWFEIILVAPGTPQVATAEDIDRALADYPVLDEMDYSNREFERAAQCWEHFSLRDRIDACRRFRVSIFAARRDDIPEDQTGELVSYLAA